MSHPAVPSDLILANIELTQAYSKLIGGLLEGWKEVEVTLTPAMAILTAQDLVVADLEAA